jgi:hypothetical protein
MSSESHEKFLQERRKAGMYYWAQLQKGKLTLKNSNAYARA